MRNTGYLLLILGVAGMVGAFFFSVTIEPDAAASHAAAFEAIKGLTEEQARPIIAGAFAPTTPIANMNLMAERAMLHITAAALAIIGAVFVGAAEIGVRK
jgi:hypothetical protein